MRLHILFLTAIFFVGCTATDNPNTAINPKPSPANNAPMNPANSVLSTTKTPEAATTNNAPTLAPVVQNYFAALEKKDEAGAKKYLSQSAIAYYQAEMKTEKSASLLAVLEDAAEPIGEKREVRNERIEGETAVAEVKGGELVNWTPIKFVRENGEWKFASPKESLALQDIPKTSANNNPAK